MRLYFLIKLQLLAFGSECVRVITVFMRLWTFLAPFPSWLADLAYWYRQAKARPTDRKRWVEWSEEWSASEMRVQWYIKTSPDVGRAQLLFVAVWKYILH